LLVFGWSSGVPTDASTQLELDPENGSRRKRKRDRYQNFCPVRSGMYFRPGHMLVYVVVVAVVKAVDVA
jgi:hypothetical protein